MYVCVYVAVVLNVVKRRIQTIRIKAEADLRKMRGTFEVGLSFIPEHIKQMKMKDYQQASPTALENADPNIRRQSSKLHLNIPGLSHAMVTPMRPKTNGCVLQTPMVSLVSHMSHIYAAFLHCHLLFL